MVGFTDVLTTSTRQEKDNKKCGYHYIKDKNKDFGLTFRKNHQNTP